MKLTLVLLCFLFAVSGLYCETYDGTIILKNGKKIEADAINIEDDVVRFHPDLYSPSKSIDKSDVRMLRVSDGNYAVEGLFLGSAAGFVFYYSAVGYDQMNATASYYSLGVGAIIGLAIGAMTSGIKSIRIDNSELSFLEFRFERSMSNNINYNLINYKLHF